MIATAMSVYGKVGDSQARASAARLGQGSGDQALEQGQGQGQLEGPGSRSDVAKSVLESFDNATQKR